MTKIRAGRVGRAATPDGLDRQAALFRDLADRLVSIGSPAELAGVVLDHVAPRLDATMGVMSLAGDDVALRVARYDADGSLVPAVDDWFAGMADPLLDPARRGDAIFASGEDELSALWPLAGALLLADGARSVVCLPLAVSGSVWGSIGFAFADPAPFEEAERLWLRLIGEACAATLPRLASAGDDRSEALDVPVPARASGFDQVGAATQVGSWEWDLRTDEMIWTDQYARLLGGTDGGRFFYSDFSRRVHHEDLPLVVEAISVAIEHREMFEIEFRVLWPDRSVHWLLGRGQVVGDDSPPARMVGIAVDATGRFERNSERQRLEAELAHSRRLESLGQLAGGVANDFNNLLTVINGSAEVLAARLTPENGRVEAEAILSAGSNAASLIRQLLTFSRRDEPAPTLVDVNSSVRAVVGLLRKTLGESIDLVVQFREGVPMVRIDHTQLEQVIINLAVNARDAMTEGGRLVIETSAVDISGDAIGIHPRVAPGHYAMIGVSDNGVGMPAAVRTKAFDPFFSTKPQGPGLGLSSVYGIVTSAGGALHLYSEEGVGTSVKLYLPGAEVAVNGGGATPPMEPAPPGGRVVLVVEDQPEVLRLADRVLSAAGYVVRKATSGDEAVARLDDFGAIDLLVTDVVMPGITGYETAERVRARFPNLPVIVMSGYSELALDDRWAPPREVLRLEKPWLAEGLLDVVRRALDAEALTPLPGG